MRVKPIIVAVVFVVSAVLVVGGCAVDPMEQLTAQIQSDDVTERRTAIYEMGNLSDPRTTEELLNVLEKDDELHGAAAVALVKKGREAENAPGNAPNLVVESVGKILANAHLAEQFRAMAAWTLGEIGSREGIAALQGGTSATVGAAPAEMVRKASTEALEKLGYASAGRPFDIAMGELAGHEIEVWKDPPDLSLPPEDES